ncbi:hypothetical protein BpHYR1_044056 [Brachionus plicatilis]|uniref:Uncharacterized protein n=1 Tax=Brachionus plicatilis TaxID=10195 RepID=A0A3M7SE34_BRAPC|nr:hypothetical protein BpHYR1_044056 [Brachionus plicatilis]
MPERKSFKHFIKLILLKINQNFGLNKNRQQVLDKKGKHKTATTVINLLNQSFADQTNFSDGSFLFSLVN